MSDDHGLLELMGGDQQRLLVATLSALGICFTRERITNSLDVISIDAVDDDLIEINFKNGTFDCIEVWKP